MPRRSLPAVPAPIKSTTVVKVDDSPISVRDDGWANVFTALGSSTRDKRLGADFGCVTVVPYEQSRALHRGGGIAKRIVKLLTEEPSRAGFDLLIEGDKEYSEATQEEWRWLGAVEAMCVAAKYQQFGGGAIWLGVQDGATDLRQPLNETRIRSFDWLKVLEAPTLTPAKYYEDPASGRVGDVEIWRYQSNFIGGSSTPLEIHESRLIIFCGEKSSENGSGVELEGWGDSVYTAIWNELRSLSTTTGSIEHLMTDISQAVLKVAGLKGVLTSAQRDAFMARAQLLDMGRSTVRTVVIGDEEEFERKATPLAQIPEIFDRNCILLSAVTGIPVTKLFGRSPAGQNATGESDDANWDDVCLGIANEREIPALERITYLLFLAHGREPPVWSIKVRPYKTPSRLEELQARFLQAQIDEKNVANQMVLPDEARQSRFGGDEYSYETQIDTSVSAVAEVELDENGEPVEDEGGPEPKKDSRRETVTLARQDNKRRRGRSRPRAY